MALEGDEPIRCLGPIVGRTNEGELFAMAYAAFATSDLSRQLRPDDQPTGFGLFC